MQSQTEGTREPKIRKMDQGRGGLVRRENSRSCVYPFGKGDEVAQDSKSSVVLAEIDLSECAPGKILDFREPDKRVEEKVFKGWNNALEWGPKQGKRLSSYRVVHDGEVPVLEHHNKTGRCLTTGEPLWADYTVEAIVRQLNAFTQPNNDDPHAIVGLSDGAI